MSHVAALSILTLVLVGTPASPAASNDRAPIVSSASEPADADGPTVLDDELPTLRPDSRLRGDGFSPQLETPAPTVEDTTPDRARSLAADVSISGTIAFVHPDGTLGDASESSTTVMLLARDRIESFGRASGGTFSFSALDPELEYYLVARDSSGRYATTYSGDTPFESEAETFAGSSSTVVITMPSAATITGRVDFEVPPTEEAVVRAWLLNETSGQFENIDFAFAEPGAEDYRLSLPAGRYIFRATLNGPANLAAQYFDRAALLDDAALLELVPGEVRPGVDFAMTAFMWQIYRVAGSDRYETSVRTTGLVFEPRIPVLYLASGENWPDALSAGPAASVQGGAMLLTHPQWLLPSIEAEIRRLQPDRVIIAGGPASVSETVLTAVRNIVPDTVRIGGSDRYETSRLLVRDAFGDETHETVFLATGHDFPDALSAAPVAGRRGEPLLLIDPQIGAIDTATRAEIEQLSPTTGFLVGGQAAIPLWIQQDLERIVDRVWRATGADRYETSEQVNAWYPPSSLNDVVFLARGDGFADALAGAAVAAAVGAPVALTPQNCLPASLLRGLNWNNQNRVFLLGGEAALSPGVARLQVC